MRRISLTQDRRNDIDKRAFLEAGIQNIHDAGRLVYPYDAPQHFGMRYTPGELSEAIRIQNSNGISATIKYRFKGANHSMRPIAGSQVDRGDNTPHKNFSFACKVEEGKIDAERFCMIKL